MSDANQNAPSIVLIGQVSKFAGQSYEGYGENIVVGRSKDCTISLDEGEISRKHARFSLVEGQWAVEDLGSSNGTSINGQSITQSTYLNAGDTIGLGANQFTFQPGGMVEKATVVNLDPVPQPAAQAPRYQQQAPPPAQPAYQPPPSQPPPAYQPPPQVQQVPVYIPVQPRRKRRGGCGLTCLIIGLVIIGVLCIGLIGTYFLAKPTLDRFIQTADICLNDIEKCIEDMMGLPSGTGMGFKQGEDVLQLLTGEIGLVETKDGASLLIPGDAVPLTESGEPGTMNFSITEAVSQTVSLESGYQSFGKVYELGPEGFTFNSPVEITLPIPDGTDTGQVMGLTFYDSATGTWKFVPGAVNETDRTVTVMSTHFSYWSIFGRQSNDNWHETHGGYIEVRNGHRYESGSYPHPDGNSKPLSLSYGVCIESYTLDNPADAHNWNEPNQWKMTVSDYSSPMSPSSTDVKSHKWWLPNGTYQLTEVWHMSEVNHLVGYIPHNTTYFRSLGTYVVLNGNLNKFDFNMPDFQDPNLVNGRPNCFGAKDTAVGTGDIQITLTWHKNVDLDLWVTEPSGFLLNYETEISDSGGELDRDNACGDMVIGRPENIFWPDDSAPAGAYLIQVNYYGTCEEEGAVDYTIRTVIDGEVKTYSGHIYDGQTLDVTTFTFP